MHRDWPPGSRHVTARVHFDAVFTVNDGNPENKQVVEAEQFVDEEEEVVVVLVRE